MKELTITEIQQHSLEMLAFFDAFAKENGLSYYLSGGTLLGAVRHKGFIPWDDDVDLMMPRPDYERMLKLFQNGRYHLSACETESDYHSAQARVWDTQTTMTWDKLHSREKPLGIFIDIFPIDGFPSNEMLSKLHLLRVKFERAKNSVVVKDAPGDKEKYVFLKKILAAFVRKSGNTYVKNLNALAKRYRYKDCDYVGVKCTVAHLFRERNSKEIFAETIYLPFHDMMLPAPSGYDAYLRHLYGDYMKLPPENQRVSTHNIHFYWRNSQ